MSFEAALNAFLARRLGRRRRLRRGALADQQAGAVEMSAAPNSLQDVDDHPKRTEYQPAEVPARGGFTRPDPTSLLAVVVLLGIAAFLRLWRLSAVGFRGDEAVYAGQAALLAHTDGMDRWFILASRGNSNFLVYQWIVAQAYRVFGVSDTAARVVSAAFSTLTVLVVYAIGRLLYDRRSAFLAGLILAVSGYAVGLGRLALLDSTGAFFVTSAMFCLLKWHLGNRSRWLVGFGILTAIAMQAKVTSVLIVPIAVVFIAVTGDLRRPLPRRALIAAALTLLSLTPAALQVLHHRSELSSFLATSSQRVSGVAWYFYLGQLWRAEGLLMVAVLGIGVVLTVLRRDRQDLLPVIWLGLFVLFLQLYPLKGFNYLLPAVPPLALLAGRALSAPVGGLAGIARLSRLSRLSRPVAIAAVMAGMLLGASQIPAVRSAMTDEHSAGMREAAFWLRTEGAAHAGTMALSHGSGQYVLSFYGGIDSYPYGRFRIATVLPGGRLVQSKARSGAVPVDWVSDWPARLIQQGQVSYLVYNTRPLDDPPEQNQVSDTITERQFRSLIQSFSGRLVHTVYWHHEARVYIYRVSKNLAEPTLQAQAVGNRVVLTARGFVARTPLRVTYHGILIARGNSDATGAAVITVAEPDPGQSQYHVVVTDAEGNTASATGLPSSQLVYTVDKNLVRVYGVRFTPHSTIRLSYGLTDLGSTVAQPDGTFSWTFKLPSTTHTRYRIRARDDAKHVAWAIGLVPPSITFVELSNHANLTGSHFLPDSPIAVNYHGQQVGTTRSDNTGAFRVSFAVPPNALPGYQLIVVDSIGRRATVTGLAFKK